LGNDFETRSKWFIDFLLLNEKRFPFIVLEVKAENKNQLNCKVQARKHAESQNGYSPVAILRSADCIKRVVSANAHPVKPASRHTE